MRVYAYADPNSYKPRTSRSQFELRAWAAFLALIPALTPGSTPKRKEKWGKPGMWLCYTTSQFTTIPTHPITQHCSMAAGVKMITARYRDALLRVWGCRSTATRRSLEYNWQSGTSDKISKQACGCQYELPKVCNRDQRRCTYLGRPLKSNIVGKWDSVKQDTCSNDWYMSDFDRLWCVYYGCRNNVLQS